jgi:hypothetical protein
LTLLVDQQVLDLPARALTPICFFNHALNSLNNLFFPYIPGLAWQAGETTNGIAGAPGMIINILVGVQSCFSFVNLH